MGISVKSFINPVAELLQAVDNALGIVRVLQPCFHFFRGWSGMEEVPDKMIVAFGYFYSKDMTSGCTKQACGFAELYPQFTEKDAMVIGVSKDTVASHQKFGEKYANVIQIRMTERELELKQVPVSFFVICVAFMRL